MMRVAITGMGAICAIADNVPEFLKALQEGYSCFREIDLFDTSGYRTHRAAEIVGTQEIDTLPNVRSPSVSRTDRFGLIAAREALEMAGLIGLPRSSLSGVGVIIGGSVGAMLETESWYLARLLEARHSLDDLSLLRLDIQWRLASRLRADQQNPQRWLEL